MFILRRLPLARNLRFSSRNNRVVTAAAVLHDAALWTPAPLSNRIRRRIAVPSTSGSKILTPLISWLPTLGSASTSSSVFPMSRSPRSWRSLLFLCSRLLAVLEFFLVKSIVGSMAEILCGLKKRSIPQF
ncbi:unnamed protein product [Brassica rapa subsp. narinosa]